MNEKQWVCARRHGLEEIEGGEDRIASVSFEAAILGEDVTDLAFREGDNKAGIPNGQNMAIHSIR